MFACTTTKALACSERTSLRAGSFRTRRPARVNVVAARARRSDGAEIDGAESIDRRRALSIAATVSAFGILSPHRAVAAANIGDKAPDFLLPGTKGESVQLSDMLKQNDFVTLYFYNQDNSPGCSIEAQRFEAAIPEFTKRRTRVLGVSMDSLEKHDDFCAQKGLGSFTLLSDSNGSVSEAYGADLKIPIFGRFSDRQTFLIKRDGTIVQHWLERDQTMASVKTTAHVNQILAAIDAASS